MNPTTPDRDAIAARIASRIDEAKKDLAEQFQVTDRVNSFILDDLLPPELALAIYRSFPGTQAMVLKRHLGESKYVGAQMDRYAPILEEVVYAFQQKCVLDLIAEITGIEPLVADEYLYAGGISLMTKGNFLNPHLDNSHDKDQNLYRVLNLLYYVTPDWREEYGGSLELWDRGPKGPRRTIASSFNRLVVMRTDNRSWHSVSPVEQDAKRCCVSNYYFSPVPADGNGSYHVTTFRGWPKQALADLLMISDNAARTVVRRLFGERLFRNPHVYRK